MAKPKLILLCTTMIFILFSAGKKKSIKNMVQVNDTLYICQFETSNAEWKEYLVWIEEQHGKSSDEYHKALPDTMVWMIDKKYNQPLVHYYFRHPSYSRYPVVGLTYEQVMAFCQWKSGIDEPLGIEYRLPTKEEWKKYVMQDVSRKYRKKILKKKGGCFREKEGILVFGNFTCKESLELSITSPVSSYYPNLYGIYNGFGNVAEMTADEGLALGGSFKEDIDEFNPNKEYIFKRQAYWLGFRYVGVIKPK